MTTENDITPERVKQLLENPHHGWLHSYGNKIALAYLDKCGEAEEIAKIGLATSWKKDKENQRLQATIDKQREVIEEMIKALEKEALSLTPTDKEKNK